MFDLDFYVRFTAALFAILNPPVNMPIFLSLTEGRTTQQRQAVAIRATIAVLVACILVAIAGRAVLSAFSIDINSFRIAGGILLFTISLTMISGARHPSHAGQPGERAQQDAVDDPAIYPLTIPIIVGPGTMSTLIIFSESTGTLGGLLAYGAGIATVVSIVGAALIVAPLLDRMVSQTARTVSIRIMGVILAALAVEMIVNGLRGAQLVPLPG